jgi:hypothetical protein
MNQVPAKLYHGTNKDKTKEANKMLSTRADNEALYWQLQFGSK